MVKGTSDTSAEARSEHGAASAVLLLAFFDLRLQFRHQLLKIFPFAEHVELEVFLQPGQVAETLGDR